MPDYSKENNLEAAHNTLAELAELAQQLDEAEREVDHRKLDLAKAEVRVRDLREILIPGLMDEVGLTTLQTSGGLTITIEDGVRAGISEERKPAALKWLDENGHGGMVKRKVTVEFARDQEEQVKELITNLRKTYPQTREEKKVETNTLKAWVRRRLKAGDPTPEDLFGIHTWPMAKLTRSKK